MTKASGWLLGASLLVAAAPTRAQDAAAARDEGELEQIIVTGEKQARTLLDTAASVGVVTAEDILKKDITTFREAFRLLGNVIDSDFVDAGFIIRGVNSEGLTPGGSPLATIYIDGAAQTVQGARRGSRGLWDVQQVEVYRGPQSTLSGRASLAGAIYIKTQDPTFEWSGAARGSIAEFDTYEGALALGGPIAGDTLAFRIAGEYQRRDSEISYPDYSGFRRFNDLREDEFYTLRGKLLAQPSDDLRVLVTYAFAHDSPALDDVAGPGFGFDYKDRRGDFNLPFFSEVRSADNHTGVLEATWDVGETTALTSLTTYVDTRLDTPSVNQGTPGEDFVTDGRQRQKYFTQELRLNFGRADDALSGVLGLYYADEKNRAIIARTTFFGGGRADFFRDTSRFKSYAIFGEATYRVAAAVRLTAGGRVNYEKQRGSNFFTRDNFEPDFPDIESSGVSRTSKTIFLPKGQVLFDVADNATLGFTVQRGFRSGGSGTNGVTGAQFQFDPEFTWNYEGSLKARLFDNRAEIALNVFYTDWKDQQVELLLDPLDFTTGVTLNAARSRVYGAELEGRARLMTDVDLFASIGHTNARFKEFVDLNLGDFSGLSFPESPRWTLAAGIDYRPTRGFFAGIDGKYVSKYNARDLQNAPIDRVGGYFVANARIGYGWENWSVTVFADNLFDEFYFTYRDVIGDFECCATVGRAQTFGVTGQVRF